MKGVCSACGSEQLWAWYEQPERQTISVEVTDDGVAYEYTGTIDSGDEPGEDKQYYCAECDRLTDTIEEMVGAPPAPLKTGVRLSIESGVPGDAQVSSFMNATTQSAGGLEFSIATFISVTESVKTEEALATLISNVLGPIVAEDPRISFEVQLGLASEPATEEGGNDDNDDVG